MEKPIDSFKFIYKKNREDKIARKNLSDTICYNRGFGAIKQTEQEKRIKQFLKEKKQFLKKQ